MTKKQLLLLLIGAYLLLGFGLGVSRMLSRPAGDPLPLIGVIASTIIYLATSLGIAWLLELAMRHRAPAAVLAKRRRVKMQHLRRKEKGVVCSQKSFRSIHEAQQEVETLRTQAMNRYLLGYRSAQPPQA